MYMKQATMICEEKSEERTGGMIWYLNEGEDELFGDSSSFDFCEPFDP
jgi:hypothetical protein